MKITTTAKTAFDIFYGGPGYYEGIVNSWLRAADRDWSDVLGFFCIQDEI